MCTLIEEITYVICVDLHDGARDANMLLHVEIDDGHCEHKHSVPNKVQ